MKVSLKFLSVLVLVLLVLYAQPILFPPQNPPSQKVTKKKTEASPDTQAGQYEKITTAGYASLVNSSLEQVEKRYGKPTKVYPTAFDTYWWIYGQNAQDYVVFEVDKNSVLSVTVLGENLDVAPFKMKMSLRQISELVPLATNFSFENEGQKIQLELSEEDLNFRPLVAFKNNTFAILQMNQTSGKLEAIRYVRQNELVALRAYQTDEENTETKRFVDSESDWEAVNQANQELLSQMIRIIRAKEKRETVEATATTEADLQASLNQVQTVPSTIFGTNERLKEWQQYVQSEPSSQNGFTLTTPEVNQLYKNQEPVTKTTTLLAVSQYDVPWTVLSWIGNLYESSIFENRENKEINVAASKNLLLISATKPGQESKQKPNVEGGD